MSSTPPTTSKAEEKPVFTAREEELLKVAFSQCLKSGPPDIDMHKFQTAGGFNTLKTAQNTWAKLKGKLAGIAAANAPAGSDEGEATTAPKGKKRGKKAAENGEEDGPPAKKKRKSPAKKVTVAADLSAAEEGDGVKVEDEESSEEGEIVESA